MKKFLIILNLLCMLSFSKELILTSNQATYTIANLLTKDTDIVVEDVFGLEESMNSNQLLAFKKINLSKYKNVKAIIDLQRVWNDDALYEHIRRENIFVVGIDASYSYQDNTSLAISIDTYHNDNRQGENNPYIWLNPNNVKKMLKIVASDLSKIFVKEKKIIEKNLDNSLKEIDYITQKYNEEININSAIVLSENLNYLISFLNIYKEYVDYSSITKENIKDIINKSGIDVILTEKPLKKEIVEELKKNKIKYAVIKTASFPEEDDEDDELMDKNGLIKILKNNLDKLKF